MRASKTVCRPFGVIVTVAMLVWSASPHAASVTWEVKGSIADIYNVDNSGPYPYPNPRPPAVDPKKIPFAVGDQVRFLVTYDSLTPPSASNGCFGGSGVYEFNGAVTGGAVATGSVTGAITGTQSGAVVVDCDAGERDVIQFHGKVNGPNIEDMPMGGFELRYASDTGCFSSGITLPTAILDPITCPMNHGNSFMSLHWNDSAQRTVSLYAIDFVVQAPTCQGLITGLAADVFALNVRKGISNALDSKLDAAIKAADGATANRNQTAINELDAFINAVAAQRDKEIAQSDASSLISVANIVKSCLAQ